MSIKRSWPRSSITPTPISASPTVALTCSSMAAMGTAAVAGLLGAPGGHHVPGAGGETAHLRDRPRCLGSTIADCCGLASRPTSRSSILTPSTRCQKTWCMIFRPGAWRVQRTRPGDPLHHRQWPGAARRRAPYRSAAGTRPQEYPLPGERLGLTAGVSRCPLSPTQERGACWGGNSGATWPGGT